VSIFSNQTCFCSFYW